MKKKIATVLLMVLVFISVLSGCNLFDTNNYMALSSVVATCGSKTVTREELITRYNSIGYYYVQVYGMSQEDAYKRMIDEILQEKYLIEYIDAHEEYALDYQDYCDVITDTWDYVNSSMATQIKEVRKIFNLSTEDISLEDEDEKGDYDTRASYETKFELIDGKIAYIEPRDEEEHKLSDRDIDTEAKALAYAQVRYNYKRQIRSGDDDLKLMVWNRYLSALKTSQKRMNYSDMSDKAAFDREIKRVFEYNLKNAKLTKFEKIGKLQANLSFDSTLDENGRYVVTDAMLDRMVSYYADLYASNVEEYTSSSSLFYKNLAGTSKRAQYVYYGEDSGETLITCTHILIKLSSDQETAMTAIEDNDLYQGEQKTDAIDSIKSQDNTYAYERDLDTGLVVDEDGITVTELYSRVLRAVSAASSLEAKVEAFNDYLYRYNVDTGIINAEFDYVVGTETTVMVETFTDLVRDLYDDGNGEVGSIGIVYEEGSYKGYHIVMYTGTLENIFASSTEVNSLNAGNIYSILSDYLTSISYGETMFEFIYDKTAKDNFSTYESDLISALMSGLSTQYNRGNYSDLIG